jgi:hypothetical protein
MIPVAIVDLSSVPDLGPGDRRILGLVDDQLTIEEIRQQTHATEFQVCKLFFDQYQAGHLKLVKLRSGGGRNAAGALTAEALIEAGRAFMKEGDFDVSLRHLRAAKALEPDNQEAQQVLTQAEKKIREYIEKAGVTLGSIPQVTATMEQLTSSQLSPSEGFMLTRINGTYDIQSILKITPMVQLDALMLFWKLAQVGYIRLLPPKNPSGTPMRGATPLR